MLGPVEYTGIMNSRIIYRRSRYKLLFSAFWPSYRLPRPTALIPGHLANQKVVMMSCDKMPNLRVVIQKNTETAFLKNRFLLLSKSYETQVRFFGMLIDSRVRSSAISAFLTIQKVKKKTSFYEIANCDQNTETAVHNTETAFQKISFSLLLKSCQNAGTAFCNETDDMSHLVRKPTICICENKDADQLRGNREADQRICFRYTDSTFPLLLKSEIYSF